MDLQAIDEGASFALHGIHKDGLNQLMEAATHLGDRTVVIGVALGGVIALALARKYGSASIILVIAVASAIFIATIETVTLLGHGNAAIGVPVLGGLGFAVVRQSRSAFILIMTAAAMLGLSEGTKELVHRKRPDLPNPVVAVPHTFSFPSGHSLGSAAIYMSLALLVARRLSSRSLGYSLIAVAFLLSVLIGFTRMYLCVHWFSDVLAGWSAGFGLAALSRWLDERWNP